MKPPPEEPLKKDARSLGYFVVVVVVVEPPKPPLPPCASWPRRVSGSWEVWGDKAGGEAWLLHYKTEATPPSRSGAAVEVAMETVSLEFHCQVRCRCLRLYL